MTNELDLAAWRRFGASNKDRCTVCGATAVVRITLSAGQAGTGRGAPMIAKQTFPFCDTHGQSAFARALSGITHLPNNTKGS